MKSLSQEKAEFLQVVAARIVPETTELDAAGLSRFFGIIDEALQDRILRKGFWGLKAMIFMGYYGQPETNEIVGYAPELDGRARLHA
ncbi:MAG: hypothetical protein IFK92_15125 [Acidobacteria bacterium]|nr:hypothetical protein [Candidatus Sulfomarinibacter kjeldsenii]